MEYLLVFALVLNPLLAALIDVLHDRRKEKDDDASWQALVETLRAEYERKIAEASNCHEQLRVANRMMESLLNRELLTSSGISISGGQVTVNRDMVGGNVAKRDDTRP